VGVFSLVSVLEILKEHEADLRKLGVLHASVFGSVARGRTHQKSDIDVLIDLDPEKPIGVFEYARLKLSISELLGGAGDIVNSSKLKPLLRDEILRESVNAF
jgi:predicted nucleotidyltransferase